MPHNKKEPILALLNKFSSLTFAIAFTVFIYAFPKNNNNNSSKKDYKNQFRKAIITTS